MSSNFQIPKGCPQAMGDVVHSVAAKIGLYRECLALAKAVKEERLRKLSIDEVRTGWREQRGAVGPALRLQIASCLDRINYARMCVPKSSLRKVPQASLKYPWNVENPIDSAKEYTVTNKMVDGGPQPEFGQGMGKRDFVPKTNWGYGNVDPDIIKKHKELTDRQYFMGPHWRGKPKPLIYEDLSFEGQITAHFSPPPKLPKKVLKRY
jgi:hypothetical protein